jgi:hypothetical protein
MDVLIHDYGLRKIGIIVLTMCLSGQCELFFISAVCVLQLDEVGQNGYQFKAD